MGANHHVRDQLVNLVRDTKDLLQMFLLQNWAGIPWKSRTTQIWRIKRAARVFVGKGDLCYSHSTNSWTQRAENREATARQFFTVIDDESLDRAVEGIWQIFPPYGYRRMTGALLSNCVRVQQVRIRESMRWVNPEGVLLRALMINTVYRRKYKVYACSMACRQQS